MPGWLDVTRLAVAGFLARYREATIAGYAEDLKIFLGWCASVEIEPLRASRRQLELYLRYLESQGYAAATVARRFGTVAGFYRYAVIDGLMASGGAGETRTRDQRIMSREKRLLKTDSRSLSAVNPLATQRGYC